MHFLYGNNALLVFVVKYRIGFSLDSEVFRGKLFHESP